jgi:L-2-hydroxyglutarate oxidase LhgO
LTGRKNVVGENNSAIQAYLLSGEEARRKEPDLSPDVCAALLVTETGIVEAASLVDSLAREIEESDYLESIGNDTSDAAAAVTAGVGLANHEFDRGEGVIVPGTRVVRIDREEGSGKGWIVQLETGWEGLPEGERGDVEAVRAEVVINAAGLNSASLVEQLLPEKERTGIWVSKGEWQQTCTIRGYWGRVRL